VELCGITEAAGARKDCIESEGDLETGIRDGRCPAISMIPGEIYFPDENFRRVHCAADGTMRFCACEFHRSCGGTDASRPVDGGPGCISPGVRGMPAREGAVDETRHRIAGSRTPTSDNLHRNSGLMSPLIDE